MSGLIGATTTTTSLTVDSCLLESIYSTGRTVSDATIQAPPALPP